MLARSVACGLSALAFAWGQLDAEETQQCHWDDETCLLQMKAPQHPGASAPLEVDHSDSLAEYGAVVDQKPNPKPSPDDPQTQCNTINAGLWITRGGLEHGLRPVIEAFFASFRQYEIQNTSTCVWDYCMDLYNMEVTDFSAPLSRPIRSISKQGLEIHVDSMTAVFIGDYHLRNRAGGYTVSDGQVYAPLNKSSTMGGFMSLSVTHDGKPKIVAQANATKMVLGDVKVTGNIGDFLESFTSAVKPVIEHLMTYMVRNHIEERLNLDLNGALQKTETMFPLFTQNPKSNSYFLDLDFCGFNNYDDHIQALLVGNVTNKRMHDYPEEPKPVPRQPSKSDKMWQLYWTEWTIRQGLYVAYQNGDLVMRSGGLNLYSLPDGYSLPPQIVSLFHNVSESRGLKAGWGGGFAIEIRLLQEPVVTLIKGGVIVELFVTIRFVLEHEQGSTLVIAYRAKIRAFVVPRVEVIPFPLPPRINVYGQFRLLSVKRVKVVWSPYKLWAPLYSKFIQLSIWLVLQPFLNIFLDNREILILSLGGDAVSTVKDVDVVVRNRQFQIEGNFANTSSNVSSQPPATLLFPHHAGILEKIKGGISG